MSTVPTMSDRSTMRSWWPLVAVCLGSFMLIIDTTVVTVALPDLTTGLHANLSSGQWVVNSYTLVLAVLALCAGSLGDRFGQRRMFLGSVGLFGLASLGCGLAPTVGLLIAARCVQGVGGAALIVTALSLLGICYRDRDRGTAFGVWMAVLGAAGALGPILGGLLTQQFGWRAIFLINLPLCLATLALTTRFIPKQAASPTGRGHLDLPGMAAFAVSSGAVTYALIRAGSTPAGWTDTTVLGLFALAALALIAFIHIERRSTDPMLDLGLFGSISFTSTMFGVLATSAVFADLIYASIWLQSAAGLSPMRTGLALIPMAAALFLASTFIGKRLSGRAPGLALAGGALLAGLGCGLDWLLIGTTANGNWLTILPGLVVIGTGLGIAGPAGGAAVVAAVPAERAGMASGAMATCRQFGQTLGVAVLGLVFPAGLGRVFLVTAALCLIAAITIGTCLRSARWGATKP